MQGKWIKFKENHYSWVQDFKTMLLNKIMWIMCNSARHIWEREFKEFGQNLRKFGSSKKEFWFQAVEILSQAHSSSHHHTCVVRTCSVCHLICSQNNPHPRFIYQIILRLFSLVFLFIQSFSYNAYCSISVGNLAVCIYFCIGPLKDTIHQNFG